MSIKKSLCGAFLVLLFVSLFTACTNLQATRPTSSPTPAKSTPTGSTSGKGNTSTAVPTGPACQASQLALTYERSQGLVGNRADQFSLRNASNSRCTLSGYPHIQMLNVDSQSIPTHATQTTSAYLFRIAPQVVSLQAEAKSYFIVEWVSGMCSNYSSPSLVGAFLQVTPPGTTSTLTTSVRSGIDGGIDACGNVVVSPVSAVKDFVI